MLKVDYTTGHFKEPFTYTIFQYQSGESYFVYDRDTLIGSIIRAGKDWIQVSGRMMPQQQIEEIGAYLEKLLQNEDRKL